jgi:hypothetical protein
MRKLPAQLFSISFLDVKLKEDLAVKAVVKRHLRQLEASIRLFGWLSFSREEVDSQTFDFNSDRLNELDG